MGDFDYSRDIAPLRGNYFSNPRMTDRERSELRGRFSNEVAPLMEVNDRIAEAAREKRRDDLSYQRSLFDLRQARAAKREERVALEKLPEIEGMLNEVFNDPKANTVTKAKAVADASVRFAPHLSKNPALEATLGAYSKRLAIEDEVSKERRAEKKQTREKANAEKFARADNLRTNAVPLETIKSTFEEDGLLDEEEARYLQDTATMTEATNARATAERNYVVSSGRQEAAARANDRRIEDFHGFLDKLEAARPDMGPDGISYDSAAPGGPAKPAFQLTDADTTRIKIALHKIHGIPYEELPKDPLALFAFALEKKYDLLDSSLPSANPTGSFFDE